jgi:hypothetical protein
MDYVAFCLISYTRKIKCSPKRKLLFKKGLVMTRLGRKTKNFVKQVLFFEVVLGLDHSLVWCCNLGTSESKLEIPRKFRKVVLKKHGEDNFGRSCEK